MSLQYAAEAVRQKGRGDDTVLVHMTPDEVGGLQALAMANGGSLTVNPETGLPEAGFLKSILPTLIGAGLMMVPGMQGVGAGFLGGTAGMIGMGVGALETLRTGDLGKGLMAGLGAYGGAGLAGGLQAAGAQGSLAAEQAAQRATQASMVSPAPSITSANAFSPVASTAAPTGLQTAMAGGVSPATTIGGNLAQAGQGVSALGTEAGRAAFMQGVGGGTGLATSAGAALAEPLTATPQMEPYKPEEYDYKGPYKPTKREVRYPGPDRDRYDTSEFMYFTPSNPIPYADGGGVDMHNNGFVVDAKTVAEVGNGSSNAGMERFARVGGQPIIGPGDGISDSIEANIEGVQPAMVARDEVYMPPNAVKAYGGGSLKKGEKKLYALMDAAKQSRKSTGRGESTGLQSLVG